MMTVFTVFRGEIARFGVRAGEEWQVQDGVLWLTFEARDFVLRSGESFTPSSCGEIMVQSLGDAPAQFSLNGAFCSAPVCVKLRAFEFVAFSRFFPRRFFAGRFFAH